jgi:DNA-binding NarL/FixJ family response regulator
MRILVVEDFAGFHQHINSLLQGHPEFRVIGEVSDGLEAVSKAQGLRPDLILMDIGLPTIDGLEAAQRIRKCVPETKIVFLTQETDADVVKEALHLGALGYVVKRQARRDLLAALVAVREGKRFVSEELARQLEP